MSKSMFYNWRKIDGYNAPINIVIGQRGVGKTFGKVKDALRNFVDSGGRFVYVVETLEDVKVLSQNKGERFFASLKEFYENGESKRSKRYYEALFSGCVDDGETDLVDDDNNKIRGGTIRIGDETCGYIIAINSYGQLKKNNFVNIDYIIIDEFIPEEIDITHLKIARKIASVVQTVARRQNVKIYMMGNSIRLDDLLLVKLGCANMKLGEVRKIKDKYGLLAVCEYINPNDYKEYTKASAGSVAGRLATLLGEDNLDKNVFKDAIDPSLLIGDKPKRSHLLFCLHGEAGSVRIHATQDWVNYYVLSDYGRNQGQRYTFERAYESNVVHYRPEWQDVLMHKYSKGEIKFESSVIFLQFKMLMKLK